MCKRVVKASNKAEFRAMRNAIEEYIMLIDKGIKVDEVCVKANQIVVGAQRPYAIYKMYVALTGKAGYQFFKDWTAA